MDVVTLALSLKKAKAYTDEKIQSIGTIGRNLSGWNCVTGLADTSPGTLPYAYQNGDYYVVSNVGQVNYKPSGDSYTGVASTVVETGEVSPYDMYRYNGASAGWELLHIGNLFVAVTPQLLTAIQQAQARANIGAWNSEPYNSSASSYNDNTFYYVVED